MRENEKFGKKPVRRSTSEEKESASVYKPRTAKNFGAEPKKKSSSDDRDSDYKPTERKERSSSRERRDRDDRFEEKRPARKEGTREGYDKKRDDKQQEGSSTYKPRTLKSKSTEKEKPARERYSEERESAPQEDQKKSFYEDKYSKPKVEKAPKSTPDKFEKPSRDKYTKSSDDKYGKPSRDKYSKSSDDKYGKPSRDKYGKSSDDKYGKPSRDKYSKSSDDRYSKPQSGKFDKFEKPSSDRIRKTTKQFVSAPEIENELKTDKDGLIRLNKYIANSGLCSRREADEFIAKGQITVNGVEVRELGTKVKLTDEVRFKDKALDPEEKVYILLNKPKDYVTTVEDPNATRTVMDLIQGACEQRVYPVGRLDRNSTGLLLFTNDGELTKQLTHPSFMKRKIYEVGLDRNVAAEDMEAIRKGVDIEGEIVAADAIEYADDYDKSIIGIEIHSGQNRIVRRIFESLNYRVTKLDRVYFAGLTKKNLPRGKWRFLSQKEVNMLKMNRFS